MSAHAGWWLCALATCRLAGRVYGKAGYKDGTVITTSVVPKSQRFQTHAITESGTVYLLGDLSGKSAAPPSLPARGVAARKATFAGSDPEATQRRAEATALSKTEDQAAMLECSICREPCEPQESDWDVTPCKHAFHGTCLMRWVTHCAEEAARSQKLTPPPSCPDCRHPLSASRFRVFDL